MNAPFNRAPLRGLGHMPDAAHYRGWNTGHAGVPAPHHVGLAPQPIGGSALPPGSGPMSRMSGSGAPGGGGMMGLNPAAGAPTTSGNTNPIPSLGNQSGGMGGPMMFDDGGLVPDASQGSPQDAGQSGFPDPSTSSSADHSASAGQGSGYTPPTHQSQEDGGQTAADNKRSVLDNALDMVQRVYKYRQQKHGLRGTHFGSNLSSQPNAGDQEQQFDDGGAVGGAGSQGAAGGDEISDQGDEGDNYPRPKKHRATDVEGEGDSPDDGYDTPEYGGGGHVCPPDNPVCENSQEKSEPNLMGYDTTGNMWGAGRGGDADASSQDDEGDSGDDGGGE